MWVAEVRKFSLVKPTIQTPYHIDFDWWSQNERNWRVHLLEYLSEEHRIVLGQTGPVEYIDVIDSETAEVRQVDAIQHLLIAHYANNDRFLTESSSLVESIFRLFLANGNAPLTAADIAERLHRSPEMILKVLSGARVYRGLRPFGNSN
jgi:hypothetical protein